jgi:hypothetical protein
LNRIGGWRRGAGRQTAGIEGTEGAHLLRPEMGALVSGASFERAPDSEVAKAETS